ADRATIANMAPEYGATCGIFPVDETTLHYLRMTGRKADDIALVEAYSKEQGLFRTAGSAAAEYSQIVELDLAKVEPSVAGPRRPQDRAVLSKAKDSFAQALPTLSVRKGAASNGSGQLHDGSVVIAAITSCTNTSNPSVMMAAGLLAKKAVEKGLTRKPWVKTSLAPGSRVVTDYYHKAGLTPYLDQLGFNIVGYGCTTCIGNSGPLPPEISKEIGEKELVAVSVLSGNRNFEGRINSEVRANYLMSPPLVVAYALAGRIDMDLTTESLGKGKDGKPVYLRDIWPTQKEVQEAVDRGIDSTMFTHNYGKIFDGDDTWQRLKVPQGVTYAWDAHSTYIKRAPYFDNMPATPAAVTDVKKARVLAKLGDSVTTDHISPAGSIKAASPAGKYLQEHGVKPADFNSYGSRRGNHEVMVRGTFANVRLRNRLVDVEGGMTKHFPSSEVMSIFDASEKYRAAGVPLVILAGKEYGSGSSRDWAAKGPNLLGVRAVVAESYERIHRSNLVGMGILPLQFLPEQNADKLGLKGDEVYDITGLPQLLESKFAGGRKLKVSATAADGKVTEFEAMVRIDTPQEILYYEHGGILQYVLRQLLASKAGR
ncbi:MAG TPA: aconitate hydratase AcnA, partial [Alphaproteobacteria bacterium]|nr:aconitate hydratase AcnA [Alphaproteobacteria bacterium]